MMSLAYKLGWGFFSHTASNGEVPPKPLLYPGNVWKCFGGFGKPAEGSDRRGVGGGRGAQAPPQAPARDTGGAAGPAGPAGVVSGLRRRRGEPDRPGGD